MDIRLIARNIYLDIFGYFSTPQQGIHLLNGHYLAVGDESPDIFYQLLKKLSKYADFINFKDAAECITTESRRHETLIAFSFDDGFEECFTKIKPVLDSFNIKGAFFINSSFIDGDNNYKTTFLKEVVFVDQIKNPMTWTQIKQLHNEGHLIGSHTQNHYRCNSLNKILIENEIKICKTNLENQLGYKCEHFAYPYGKISDFNVTALEIAQKYHKYIYSQDDYRNYFSFNNQVINRRHFEGNWNINHVKYFLKSKI